MSLKMWFPLTGNLQDITHQSSNIVQANATVENVGKIGKCYYLNGTNGRMYTQLFTPASNNFSICCWYKAAADNTASGYIMGLSQKTEPSFMVYKAGSTNFRLYGNGGQNSFTHGKTLTEWHHLTLTYNGTQCKFYIDGVQKSSRTFSVDFTASNYRIFLNARSNNSSNSGAGSVYGGNNYYNDLRYYDHTLSLLEIKEISKGLILHWKFDQQGAGENLLLHSKSFTNSDFVLSLASIPSTGIVQMTPTSGSSARVKYKTNLDYDDYNNQTYTISFDAQEIESENPNFTSDYIRVYYAFNPLSRIGYAINSSYDKYSSKNLTLKGEGWQHYSLSFTAPTSLTAGTNDALASGSKLVIQFWRSSSTKPVQIKNIKLEIGSSETAYSLAPSDYGKNTNIIEDNSGYNNYGISTAKMTVNKNSGRYNYSSYFGEYNSPSVSLNNTSILPSLSNCSISWWGKYDTQKTLLIKGQSGDYYLAAVTDSEVHYHNNATVTTFYRNGIAGSYTGVADTWYFFTMTGVDISSWTQLYINKYNSNWPFKGYISDFRIYSTVLSANDVKNLYKTSMFIDNDNNMMPFEINENKSSIVINKQGQLQNSEIQEDTNALMYRTGAVKAKEFIER